METVSIVLIDLIGVVIKMSLFAATAYVILAGKTLLVDLYRVFWIAAVCHSGILFFFYLGLVVSKTKVAFSWW